MQTLFDGLEHLIGSTEGLAKLGAVGAWIFFTLILIIYVVWLQRQQAHGAQDASESRVKHAEATVLTAKAIEKLADQIQELRYKLKCVGGQDEKH